MRELKSNSVLSDIKEDYKPSKDYKRRESRVEPKDAKNTKDAKSKNNKEDLSKDKRDRKDQPKSKLNQDERMKLYNEALNKQIVNIWFNLQYYFLSNSLIFKLGKRNNL